jgi:hypothetical protein
MNDENEEVLLPLPATLRQAWEIILSPEDLEKALGYASNPDATHDIPHTFRYADPAAGGFVWVGTDEGRSYWQERFHRVNPDFEETDEGMFLRCQRAPGRILLDPSNAAQPFTREDFTIERVARITHQLPAAFFRSFAQLSQAYRKITEIAREYPNWSDESITDALCTEAGIDDPFSRVVISWDLLEENPNTLKYRLNGEYDWVELTLEKVKLNPETNRMEGRVHPEHITTASMRLGCLVRVEE